LPLPECATNLTKGRILRRGSVLKITRAVNGEVVFRLSGRMDAENVAELKELFGLEALDVKRRSIVLDLEDLTLVDRDAVKFLGSCEADSIKLKNCPAYIREWITRERGKA
jgi:anti-anti-sigma regulatory factor